MGEKFRIIQCIQSQDGASGSCAIIAKLCVHFGTFKISNDGFIFFHIHEYFAGIFSQPVNAVLVIENNFQVSVEQSEAHVEFKLQDTPKSESELIFCLSQFN
ncbi:MAG: hypothetical protein WCG25_02165 [bacterium]